MKKSISKKIKRIVFLGILSLLIGVICMVGLSGHIPHSFQSWLLNGGYSIMLGLGLFGNGYVYGLFEKKWVDWLKHPFKSLIISFLITTIYSSVVIFFTNWFWYILLGDHSWKEFLTFGRSILIINYIALYIVALFFYARGFFSDWKQSIISEQQLKQEALSLQYKVLSNQVNPHFLFNSLNVLSSLISIDKDRAQIFVNKLSGFYRDLLTFKGKDIVSLQEECDFVNQYLDLQAERFGDNIRFENKVKMDIDFQIIPMTLQMLVENAIKHNQISKDHALNISIYNDDEYLMVENSFKPYLNPVDGERLGLKNLSERYKYLSDKAMVVENENQVFRVKVPLLKLDK